MQQAQVQVLPKNDATRDHRTSSESGWQSYSIFPVRWSSNSNQVGPAPPALPPTQKPGKLSFSQAFGVFGVLMLLMLLVSFAWTSWLIALTWAPTWTANCLMNTATFDDGNFWLIIDTEPWMRVLSLTGLGLVTLGYLFVLLKMVLWRDSTSHFSERLANGIASWSSFKQIVEWVPQKLRLRRKRLMKLWEDITGFHGSRRKFWVISSLL